MSLTTRWLRWMERRGSHRSISRDGQPYLERYFLLRLGRCALFLHVFLDSDIDDVHDHPWPWSRLILKGSYREHHHDWTFDDCGPGNLVLWRPARDLHRVELTDGLVWTLFFHGPRCRQWGFYEKGEWIAAEHLGVDSRKAATARGWIFPRYPRPA